jgi:NTE family protein
MVICGVIVTLAGCASYGDIQNTALTDGGTASTYSVKAFQPRFAEGENSFILAFSGGGTRAAALSYGVLKALRDVKVDTSRGEIRLLDAVDAISSVSGGSFTSVYYGLHGDGIFSDYESVFLRKNVQGELLKRLSNPFNWFRSFGRTELAVEYYEGNVFRGATYSDMLNAGGPLILVNASDLAAGNSIWFSQDYFNLLCSDILDFPVSRAVAASSAVPGLFTPVVLQNFADCQYQSSATMEYARAAVAGQPQLEMELRAIESYFDKEKRPYVHLVDGGITDNLGLRALYNLSVWDGGVKNYYQRYGRKPPRRVVVVIVDAATEPGYQMNRSNQVPYLTEVMEAMSSVQLHRYTAATLTLTQQALAELSRELSKPEHPVETYFIHLSLGQVTDPVRQAFFNNIPTSFSLSNEQVDALIEIGGELLQANPDFRRLMADIEAVPEG